MNKVLMLNPNWVKGYIDKYLLMPMHCEYIVPIHRYDPSKLSHIQYMHEGDYIFHHRYYLGEDRVSESQYMINGNKMVKAKHLTLTEPIMKYVNAIRDPLTRMFPIFKGIDMSVYEIFDCEYSSRKRFLTPLAKADGEMYEYILGQLKHSRNKDCPIQWTDSVKLPRWMNVRERLVTNDDNATVLHISDHWVLFHNNGKCTMPELKPTKGAHVDQTSKRTLKVYTEAPQAMPDDVVRAMCITIGANPIREEVKGVAWTLYSRNKF